MKDRASFLLLNFLKKRIIKFPILSFSIKANRFPRFIKAIDKITRKTPTIKNTNPLVFKFNITIEPKNQKKSPSKHKQKLYLNDN
ncbi:Hypothetical protein CFV354_0437 [Campylobacter fetus subsp. venerealis NCTC 10354]|nr:Hypothetical protein CFV354_0437 [Campylobacter fetus subsp. venerealis NCTC 10354]